MSRLISFSINFSPEQSPTALLERLMDSDFINFLSPKIGRINVEGNILQVGAQGDIFSNQLFPNERVIAPGITSLAEYPDAAPEISRFVKQFPQAKKCYAEIFGDTLLEYVQDGNGKRGRISQFVSEDYHLPIVRFYMGRLNLASPVLLGLSAPCSWFFLKSGWAQDGFPYDDASKIAEYNWERMVDAVQSIIQAADVDAVEETALNLEGSTVYKEKDWLIAKAQRLPKFIVNFA